MWTLLKGRVSQAGYVIASHSILWVAVACPCSGCLLLVTKSSCIIHTSLIFIHVLVLLCESVFQCTCVLWRCYLCDFVYSFVYICIHVCIHSTVFLLIACIIGPCWLCIIVSCEFALHFLEWSNLNLNLNLTTVIVICTGLETMRTTSMGKEALRN